MVLRVQADMDQPVRLTQDEIVKARNFHLQHFPNRDVPDIETSQPESDEPLPNFQSNDLGHYEDGTRRTLTDEQIALFRHSEIQRLLAERRRCREAEEDKREEHQYIRGKQKRPKASAPSRYDDDTTVHARSVVDELTYEEGGVEAKKEKNEQPKKFQWPLLGS